MTDEERRMKEHNLKRALNRLCKHNYEGTLTDCDVYEVICAYEAIHGNYKPENEDG